MTRTQSILAALGAVLVVVLFWLLLWTPKSDELAEVRAEIEGVQQEQEMTRTRIQALQAVRDRAPEIEARLAAASSLIPRDTALPSVLRQLQLAADESGAVLLSVSPGRPAPVEETEDDLAAMTVSVQLAGSYFQIVDFLRRVEQPDVTPRGLIWSDLALGVEEYPQLSANLTGTMYASLPSAPPPSDEPEEAEETGDDEDADVEIEVEE